MKEMSHEAQQLVDAGREAFRPTEADRARLIMVLTGATALSATVVGAAGAGRLWSGLGGVVNAGRLLAVALPIAATGAYFLHTSAQSASTLQVTPPAAVVASRPARPSIPAAENAVLQAPSEPRASALPERSAPPAGEALKPGQEIRQEVALLSKAQTALSTGRLQEALEALAEHARRFPRGKLSEERAATRARTLCALGRVSEAEAELKRIERLNPTSAYLARARESCGSR